VIEFYFDFISPYAYLAFQRIHALGGRHGREVVLRPTLFAALLNHWGQLGPAEIPPKREFVFKQVVRRARAIAVPLLPPPSHPFNPLLGLRVATLDQPRGRHRALVDCLFRATWGGGEGIESPQTTISALDSAGFEGEAMVAAALAPDNKRRLLEAGEAAIARGVFGVPTMIADGELFFGDDSLQELEGFLRGEDPIDAALVERWRGLPVGASRRRPS